MNPFSKTPQAALTVAGECQSGGFSNRRARNGINRLLTASPRLFSMEGVAPGSQFSWFEEIKAAGGKEAGA